MQQRDPTSLTINEDTVVMRRTGRSAPTVANILGVAVDEAGKRTIWLDRVIHHGQEQQMTDEWIGSGAVSTVLTES
ncbi:hypothetical protein H8Z72_23500 (plasmid) [Xanthomonas citri pv. citri]|uniref:hypothetical protein n=1 Tax=Xanthomonas citri TaxID=346 RepID=UPI0019317FE6|nr:hypothetical protein [Xanthomonas citri]QRD62719.1 hypothetical protein H8Z74_22685 [Xanthomonas citri pv. citri]QRD67046.1 hypothetical protein H8Z73_22770 [Xanthomonas citri pv. citri]QRD71701.1 hypothetical protein H8Z72_23500 [Xanthomonas citri pv. citri]